MYSAFLSQNLALARFLKGLPQPASRTREIQCIFAVRLTGCGKPSKNLTNAKFWLRK